MMEVFAAHFQFHDARRMWRQPSGWQLTPTTRLRKDHYHGCRHTDYTCSTYSSSLRTMCMFSKNREEFMDSTCAMRITLDLWLVWVDIGASSFPSSANALSL